jgi:NOL1/NOP2/fmu family ribosome biogenesis protein
MSKLIILNTREIKKLREMVTDSFGYFFKRKYVYLRNDKNKVFIINRDIDKIDLAKLRIDRMGLYLAEMKKGQCRLSKEGAQLLVKEAEENNEKLKNVVDLDDKEVKEYFKGLDLDKDLGDENRFMILKFCNDTIGCAKYKNGKILNFLPKIHRGEVII